MKTRLRTLAFVILVTGLSSIVLLQAFQTTVASFEKEQAIASMPRDALMPLQIGNSTASNQTMPSNNAISNSTAQSSLSVQLLSSSSQPSSASVNQTAAVSYLQYQMTSMNDELSAMSSRMNSMSQDTGMNTLIAEAGLIIGILAIIAIIAVARRADAMYRDASRNQPSGAAPEKK